MAGAATALKTADVHAHAVIGQSQPERHGDAEILSALRFRPLMLPGARHHDLARVWPHILPVEIRALSGSFSFTLNSPVGVSCPGSPGETSISTNTQESSSRSWAVWLAREMSRRTWPGFAAAQRTSSMCQRGCSKAAGFFRRFWQEVRPSGSSRGKAAARRQGHPPSFSCCNPSNTAPRLPHASPLPS